MFSKLFNKKQNRQEFSKGGSAMFRYKKPAENITPSYGDEKEAEVITKHIETYIGKVKSVYHEVVSAYSHIDVNWIAPTRERNYHTLITTGMSYRPMNVPTGMENLKYGELLLCLPTDWKLTEEDFTDENNYWPIQCLKILA